MLDTSTSWRRDKPLRRLACKGKTGYALSVLISEYQTRKRNLVVFDSNNDETSREIQVRLLYKANVSRRIAPGLKDNDRAEQLKIARRAIRQARSMRLNFGLPKFLHQQEGLYVDQKCNLIPIYHLEQAFSSGIKMYGFPITIIGRELYGIIDKETRLAHRGRWSHEDLDEEKTVGPNIPRHVTFWFEHITDLAMFKLRYSGRYEEIQAEVV
jgi:hypothetical protein